MLRPRHARSAAADAESGNQDEDAQFPHAHTLFRWEDLCDSDDKDRSLGGSV